LAQVAGLLDLQTGWIWLLREDTGESELAAAQNLPPALANAPRRMEGSCYCLDTFQAGDLSGAANVNVVTCSRLKGLVDGTDGLRYHASIPLYAYGKKLGVLNVASTDWRELAPDDLRLLYTVGDLVSIAIERARLFARSAQLGAAEERNRLAREIHDTLAQGLTAITLQLETADALLEGENNPERVRQAVQQALALTRANLEEARRSVLDLRAAPLEGRTLAEALSTLAAQREWSYRNLRVEFNATGESRSLPLRIEASLYRIAQEALTNVVRHAQARHATLHLATLPDQVQLVIEDDGRGFDPNRIPKGRYGLIGLNERVKLLGGSLKVLSSPGAGARIEALIPLKER
jgi:two-component system NarL family sensor kinase